MARKPKATPPASPDIPPAYLFTWQGEEADLRDFTEFRYWRNPDTGAVSAKLCGKNEKFLTVTTIEEARQIEAKVNPFWGRS